MANIKQILNKAIASLSESDKAIYNKYHNKETANNGVFEPKEFLDTDSLKQIRKMFNLTEYTTKLGHMYENKKVAAYSNGKLHQYTNDRVPMLAVTWRDNEITINYFLPIEKENQKLKNSLESIFLNLKKPLSKLGYTLSYKHMSENTKNEDYAITGYLLYSKGK